MENLRRSILALLLVVVFSCGTGCAFGTRDVELQYPPEENISSKLASEANAAPLAVQSGKEVLLIRFEDKRTEKERIGQVRNTYGMVTAKVVAANDVSDWLTNALKTELENAGYQVRVSDAKEESSNTPVIKGEILTVFCDSYLTYEGEVSLYVVVENNGQEILREKYSGKGGGINVIASSEGFGNALAMALQNAAKNFIGDLNNLQLE